MAKFSSENYYKLVKHIPRTVAFGQSVAYKIALRSKRKHFFINKDVSEVQTLQSRNIIQNLGIAVVGVKRNHTDKQQTFNQFDVVHVKSVCGDNSVKDVGTEYFNYYKIGQNNWAYIFDKLLRTLNELWKHKAPKDFDIKDCSRFMYIDKTLERIKQWSRQDVLEQDVIYAFFCKYSEFIQLEFVEISTGDIFSQSLVIILERAGIVPGIYTHTLDSLTFAVFAYQRTELQFQAG